MKKATLALSIIFSVLIVKTVYAECIDGNCSDGFGTKVYPSGSKYVGRFKDGKEHGKGTYYFFNGSLYEGEFKNGKFTGKGKWVYSNGMKYLGEFRDGKIWGKGEFLPLKKLQDEADIIDILPADVDLLITVPSIRSIFRNFSVKSSSVFGNPVDDLEEVIKTFGINPFNIWKLKSIGIDTGKKAGFFLSDIKFENKKKPEVNIILFIPVTDGNRLADHFIKKAEKNKNIRIYSENDFTLFLNKKSKEKLYMFRKKNYIFFGGNPAGNSESYISSLIKGKTSLNKSRLYKRISVKLTNSDTIFGYININEILKNNNKRIEGLIRRAYKKDSKSLKKTMSLLRDYKGAGFTLDLENRNLLLNFVYYLKNKAKSMEFIKGIVYNKDNILAVEKNPLLLFTLGINFEKYYNYLMNTWSKQFVKAVKNSFVKTKKEYKIDVEKEIIKNLAGNINLALYEGKTLNMFNYNSLFTFTIKNRKVMDRVFKKIARKIPPQMFKREKVGAINAYVFTAGLAKIYAGIKNRIVIIASGRNIFKNALYGNPKSGFLSKMKEESLVSMLKMKSSFFYLDIDELMYALKNFMNVSKKLGPEKIKMINKFHYLLASSRYKKNYIYANFKVKTEFNDPFFIGLKNFIGKVKQKSAGNKKR